MIKKDAETWTSLKKEWLAAIDLFQSTFVYGVDYKTAEHGIHIILTVALWWDPAWPKRYCCLVLNSTSVISYISVLYGIV